jgi:tyrosyl-tRNA synthetase
VWLNADKLSPYDFWQFWRNTEDADVARFLKLFTELSLEEIAKLEALGGAEINEAKKILATAVTTLCHGEKAAIEAEKTAKETFEQGLSSAGLPTTNIPKATLEKGLPLLEALVQADLTPSKSEARRFIKVGAIRINDCVIQQEQHLIRLEDFQQGETLKLSVGKKKHGLLKIA